MNGVESVSSVILVNALLSQPQKATASEKKTNCHDQPLQNILVLQITVEGLENSISMVLKISLFYKTLFFLLDFLFFVVKQKGQVPAGISQLFSLHCCDRSKLTCGRF